MQGRSQAVEEGYESLSKAGGRRGSPLGKLTSQPATLPEKRNRAAILQIAASSYVGIEAGASI